MAEGNGSRRQRQVPAPIVVVGCFGAAWLAHRLRPIRFLPDSGAWQWAAGAAIVLLGLAVARERSFPEDYVRHIRSFA